jgi:murein DD-endopeptidase MepM/ murein hydrolase activator NlpD
VPGTWSVIHGGRAELVNQHRAALVQDDALDIVQIVDGATHRGDPTVLANYFVFGQPVTAPAAGRVAAAVGDLPDQRIGESDPRRPAGNHVVIDIGGGRYVALGHLRAGSLAVRLGEQVVAGQRIAEVGNSGNSSEPHLHMQVQNAPAFDVETPVAGARTFPWLVADVNVTRVWAGTTRPTSADLRRGDTFTAANPLTP